MTNNPDSPTRTTQLTTSTQPLTATPNPADHTFEMRFTSTPRGVRLARRLAAVRLDAWGIPYGSEPHDEIDLIVAELSANAVRHGHVPGQDFHLRLRVPAGGRAVRVEVTDARAERVPRPPAVPDEAGVEETGRGLLLVSRLATRWGWHPCPDGPGKTVWAERALPGRTARAQPPQDVSRGQAL